MKEHKLINPENPVFTLIESPYAYNPNHNTTINYTPGINALPISDRELAIF